MRGMLIGVIGLALMGASAAWADDPSEPPPDKSGFTLFNPTPDGDLRSLCTDRPTKSTAPCTVDAGHWQLESDIYNFTTQTTDGVTTTTQLFTNPTYLAAQSRSPSVRPARAGRAAARLCRWVW